MPPTTTIFHLLIALLLCAKQLHAQNAVLDSLTTSLQQHTKNDTVRVNLLNAAGFKISSTHPDKALTWFREAESLAGQLRYPKGQAYSLLHAGNIKVNRAEYAAALRNFEASFSLYEDLGDKAGMANNYFNFGRCQFYLGKYGDAVKNYDKAIALSEVTGDQRRLAASLIGVSVILARQGEHAQAMENYKRAIKIEEKTGNRRGVANALSNLANLYKLQNNVPMALETFNRAIEIRRQLGDQLGIASNLDNMASTYRSIGKLDEAFDLHIQALELFEKAGNRQGIASSLTNAGVLLLDKQAPDRAMEFFVKGKRIAEQIGDRNSIAVSLINIGALHMIAKRWDLALAHFGKAAPMAESLGIKKELCYIYVKSALCLRMKEDYDAALEYLDKASSIADALNFLDQQRDIASLRGDIHFENERYKLAYEEFRQHQLLTDKLAIATNLDKAAEIKYRYQLKDSLSAVNKKTSALKKSLTKADTQLEATRNEKLWWIAGSILLLGILAGAIYLMKRRRKKMEQQQRTTEQKLLRAQMNPHFIFNSIDNVQSLIYNNQEQDAVEYLSRFSKLTRQILETSDANYISLAEERDLLTNYMEAQKMLYGNKFSYEIEIDEDLDPDATLLPPMLTQPYIENAIKHGLKSKTGGGAIKIRFYLQSSKLMFEVTDNGSGFSATPVSGDRKSLAMAITKKRLERYTQKAHIINADTLRNGDGLPLGARVSFEIPYFCEN